MKFAKLKGAKSADGKNLTLRFLDDQNREQEVTLPPELAFQVTLAIRQALARAPAPADDIRRSLVYRLAGCQKLAADPGLDGIVLVTHEGFQIPLSFGAEEKAHLLRTIDAPIPPETTLTRH